MRTQAEVSAKKDTYWALSRYDIAAHAETPLPEITQNVNKIPGNLEELTIAPDGKNLLWRSRSASAVYTAVVSLDSPPRCQWFKDSGSMPVWFSDSRHWGTIENMQRSDNLCYMNVHSLDKPAEKKRRAVIFPSEESCYNPGWQGERIQNDAVVSDDYCWDTPPSQASLLQVNLSSPAEKPKHYKINLPPGIQMASIAFAPQSNQVAWLVRREYTPLLLQRLHRVLPFIPAKPQKENSIWLCHLDGSNLHELGHLFVPAIPPASSSPANAPIAGPGMVFQAVNQQEIGQINWIPGGRKLSFVYQNKLYVLPVDKR